MKVRFLERDAIARNLKRLMDSYDEYYWAVAWGTENKLVDQLVSNSKKTKQLIFGTDFYQTSPGLLERFKGKKFARVMPNNSGGTFHPKVYMFIKGDKAAAIVGSANFTRGGISVNAEAALYIEGEVMDDAITDIRAMVAQAWKSAMEIDQDFLDGYSIHYLATAKHRKELEKPRKAPKAKPGAKNKKLQLWSWGEYSKEVRKDPSHLFNARLALLREARRMLSSVDEFSDLSPDERRAIAGILSYGKEHRPGEPIVGWKCFGSMSGAGEFSNIVIESPKYLSEALGHIPLTGEVTKAQYDRYIACFRKAFIGKKREGGVPTASRLLAMKRPDTFVCIDSKNRRDLGSDLGFAQSMLNFEKYWNEVVMPISESVWWLSDRPSGADGALWDGRAAMLDAIYYDEGE